MFEKEVSYNEQHLVLSPESKEILFINQISKKSTKEIFTHFCEELRRYFDFETISISYLNSAGFKKYGIPMMRSISDKDTSQGVFVVDKKYPLSTGLLEEIESMAENSINIIEIKNLQEYVCSKYGVTQDDLAQILNGTALAMDFHIPEASIIPLWEGVKSNLRIFIKIGDQEAFMLILSNKKEGGFIPTHLIHDWEQLPLYLTILRNSLVRQIQIEENESKLRKETTFFSTILIHFITELSTLRDNETGQHLKRVQQKGQILLQRIMQLNQLPAQHKDFADIGITKEQLYESLNQDEWDELADLGADFISTIYMLHDIGKVGIPDAILLKNGSLSEEEYLKMQTHVICGEDIVSKIERSYEHSNKIVKKLFKIIRDVTGGHHEKWNGRGYPRKKTGKQIPFHGRLVALIDVHDALSNERVYKKAWPFEQVMNYYKKELGEAFDPILGRIALSLLEQFVIINNEYSDEDF